MDTDLLFVVGIVVAVLAFPAIVGAYSEGRPPRAAAILVLIGGGLIAIAVYQKPNTYKMETIPDAFVRVVGKYIG